MTSQEQAPEVRQVRKTDAEWRELLTPEQRAALTDIIVKATKSKSWAKP